ncbi:uncharacterized protein K02A2.6-like [Haliotis rubra]|uniref:uncharacterized protein K02A2.6-like n=1 Tax=Haliotis rubra TaxID=36100 RepID=UPI001EE55519|nr:uncharacterized protein K02A2.6-like [Haliotis rubra]
MANVLSVLQEKGPTLNAGKCQFRMENLQFLGHVLSEKGVSPAEDKVRAVLEAREPSNTKEIRSFLGLVNFNGRYIENLSTVSEPLRRLTRSNVKFVWGPEQQASFNQLKKCLTSANVLGYFDKNAPTQVIADASPVGIGAVLVQEQRGVHRVISYASKSLSDIERRYSQTEKEALALVWAWKWYTVGNTKYVPVRNELSAIGKIVLRGTRILIPKLLRENVLQLAHEGHPGIVRMKQRLRSKVWWPGIDADAEKFCRSCHGCQVVALPKSPPPMCRTPLPTSPWQHLAADLMGPLPTGEHVFVVVDYYSRYFELDVIKNTTAESIVDYLTRIFTTHGLPLSLKTDNGPQFTSKNFKEYLRHNGVEHKTSTPYWPQANGEVERQNQTILKRIKIAQVEGKDWKTELIPFLIMYRTTPQATTGKSPSELLFRRTVRTKLPEIENINVDGEVRDHDNELKYKGKVYSDRRRHATQSTIECGEKVLVKKQVHDNKLSTSFHKEPFTVVNRYGNTVEVGTESGPVYRRNVTHVKKYNARSSNGEKDISIVQPDNTVPTDLPSARPLRFKSVPTRYKDFVLGYLNC